ncbi:hypothetical protein FD724_24040 [Nostoc sp. C057]|uniref:hypothetical protein n=1 Tax=Nostoc sp. C057 TaxID=2576903 RepID=UPI0015C2FC85|nr:hypothetical protein [Nostoc sp. C057]QLE50859.1 hypothetical protein FD724_24040 [Nostoc sp. C057]
MSVREYLALKDTLRDRQNTLTLTRISHDTVGRGVWGVWGVRFLPHPPTPPTLLDFSVVRNPGLKELVIQDSRKKFFIERQTLFK